MNSNVEIIEALISEERAKADASEDRRQRLQVKAADFGTDTTEALKVFEDLDRQRDHCESLTRLEEQKRDRHQARLRSLHEDLVAARKAARVDHFDVPDLDTRQFEIAFLEKGTDVGRVMTFNYSVFPEHVETIKIEAEAIEAGGTSVIDTDRSYDTGRFAAWFAQKWFGYQPGGTVRVRAQGRGLTLDGGTIYGPWSEWVEVGVPAVL